MDNSSRHTFIGRQKREGKTDLFFFSDRRRPAFVRTFRLLSNRAVELPGRTLGCDSAVRR